MEEHYKETLMRMTDDNGDTALHMAVWSRHQDEARLLVKEDPEFEFPSNKAREIPLYLAAESGLRKALSEILDSCKQPTSSTGPLNRTPLHAKVIQEHTDCARLLMQWNRSLCKEPDVGGWNSLHFAALLRLKEVVSDMLVWKRSLAYLLVGSENDWTTAIHIAASAGKIDVLHELLNHCPDCWEMLDSNGRNAIHEAIFCSKANVENKTLCDVAVSCTEWTADNKTPCDVAVSCTEWTADKDRIAPSLFNDFFIYIAHLGGCLTKMNQMDPRPMSYKDLGYLWSLSKVGARSQLVVMSAVVIAFVIGMYATLAHSVGLSITVCSIGCISFIMYVWAALRPVCWIGVAKRLDYIRFFARMRDGYFSASGCIGSGVNLDLNEIVFFSLQY
ncbi:putative gibberellin 2-beta-dioxygenase 1-like [Capsicum annuum]|nr:putative gibberellin 2-beta-dioxygenase 1-like [Capsicum annuum]KAF3659497.1 putative gibberellin 2-beta-dioxygenase 1-like [Capsicum annuum]